LQRLLHSVAKSPCVRVRGREHPAGLTSREVGVLGLVAAGMTCVRIAGELYLSPRTVETHITSGYHKLGVN